MTLISVTQPVLLLCPLIQTLQDGAGFLFVKRIELHDSAKARLMLPLFHPFESNGRLLQPTKEFRDMKM